MSVVWLWLCVIPLLACGASVWHNVWRRMPNEEQGHGMADGHRRLTLLLCAQGNPTSLDEHLPLFLTQDYPDGYDVIVVAEKNDADTSNILKRYRHHQNLYYTFIPANTRYMSQKKLAITLGVKAAKTEWILLCEPTTKPDSQQWLRHISSHCEEGSNLVLGYTHFEIMRPTSVASESEPLPSHYPIDHLYTYLYCADQASRGTAYRTNCYCVAFRKSEFLLGGGFQGFLKYSIGEYDFLVNKFAREGGTRLAMEQEAWMTEEAPSVKQWENRHIYHHEVCQHLERTRQWRLRRKCDTFWLYAAYITGLAALAIGITVQVKSLCDESTDYWPLPSDLPFMALGAAGLTSLILTIAIRWRLIRYVMHRFRLGTSPWHALSYELRAPWRAFRTRLRYEYADPYDFISHKV